MTTPPGTRLILATADLLDLWGTRTERGERITVEWGEPSPEGWYTPTFTTHADDTLAAVPLDRERLDDLSAAAVFMLDLVDQYYGTDHEFDIPEEAEFRYYRAVIAAAALAQPTEPDA